MTWVGLLPPQLVPRQLQTSHVVAEIATASALSLGAVLSFRERRAHWTLAAALGALAYASLNVMSDFIGDPIMLLTLAATLVFTLMALVFAFAGPDNTDEEGTGR